LSNLPKGAIAKVGRVAGPESKTRLPRPSEPARANCRDFVVAAREWSEIGFYPERIEIFDDNALNILTDGSSYNAPSRTGGWAFTFYTVDENGKEVAHERQTFFSVPGADAQEMELTAVVKALQLAVSDRSPVDLDTVEKVVIWTDSQYVHEGFNAAIRWAQNQWNRSSGAPVMNAKLWQEVIRLRRRIGKPVITKWIAGKSSERTKAIDKLAKKSAKGPKGKPQKIKSVRRKWTEEAVEPGSVPVEGQEIEIRIVGGEYLPLHREYRYKYEVVSGPFQGKMDFVVSPTVLRHRSVYLVRLNTARGNPRIVEIISEVPAVEHEARPRR
jgi:ribonuclease HI